MLLSLAGAVPRSVSLWSRAFYFQRPSVQGWGIFPFLTVAWASWLELLPWPARILFLSCWNSSICPPCSRQFMSPQSPPLPHCRCGAGCSLLACELGTVWCFAEIYQKQAGKCLQRSFQLTVRQMYTSLCAFSHLSCRVSAGVLNFLWLQWWVEHTQHLT